MPNWKEQFDTKFVLLNERQGGFDAYGFYIKANPEAIKDFIQFVLNQQKKEIAEKLIADIPDDAQFGFNPENFKQRLRAKWL